MGHCRVGVLSGSNLKVNAGLTCPLSQEEIMELQCEFLISNFNDPNMNGLVRETIEHVSDGSSSHCAGALKLWFKKAFELKKTENIGRRRAVAVHQEWLYKKQNPRLIPAGWLRQALLALHHQLLPRLLYAVQRLWVHQDHCQRR